MDLREVAERLGFQGAHPEFYGTCPYCREGVASLVEDSDGKRALSCSNRCNNGDMLAAGGMTAMALLEHFPLPWDDFKPNTTPLIIHEAKIINSINSIDSINSINPDEWPQPIPLEDDMQLPTFPVDCLPSVARDYALAIAEFAQVSVDMAAVALMAIIALCAQRMFHIRGKPGWVEQLSLFFAIFAPPAERKSSISDIVSRPIIRYEEHANELLQYEIDYYEAEREVIEREMKKAMTSGKATVEEIADKKHRLSTMEKKHLLRLWTNNATSEAVVSLMAENDGKIGIISAEPGIFEIMSGRYTSGGVDIEVYLSAHDGDAIRIDRKGRPPEYVERPAMTMLVFGQPVMLDGLMSNSMFRGRGLNARFLYSIPVSKVGQRRFDTAPIPPETQARFEQVVTDILSMDVPEDAHILTLDASAQETFAQYFDELEPRLKGDLEPIGDWAGKLHGTTLRIAGVLHCMEHGVSSTNSTISNDTMLNSITIGKYFLEHAKAAYKLMGADKTSADARYILRQLEKDKPQQITRTELTRLCRSRFTPAEEMNPATDLLIEYGYFREERTSVLANNRRQLVYKINPLTYGICGISGT